MIILIMKFRHFIIITNLLFLLISCSSNNSSASKNQYLGQTPPGLCPELFAPGRLTGAGHGFPTFSPDGKEVYWSIIRFVDEKAKGIIMFMQQLNGIWTPPQQFPYSGEYLEQAANFSLDGNRLYFQSIRPGGHGGLDIWYVERIDSGWSEPQNIGPPVNSNKHEGQPSFTKDGTIYFLGDFENGKWGRGIYRSRFRDGKYLGPELLGEKINTEYVDAYPFISSDESFLLFSSTRPSMEEKDIRLFISFRTTNDTWTDPINLCEKMNFDKRSRFPYIEPDGKYLFFCSGGSIYWVDSKIIERFRPNE